MDSDNKEQEEVWNGRLGEGFLNAGEYIDRIVAPFTIKAIEAINPGTVSYTHLTLPTNREV